jgi:hypothetical protein
MMETRYRLRANVSVNRNGEESVVWVHRGRGDMDFFGVDCVGTFMLESLAAGRSNAECARSLSRVFNISQQKAKRDLEGFVSRLVMRKIVEEHVVRDANGKPQNRRGR